MLFPNFIERQSFVPPAKPTIPVHVLHPLTAISTTLVLLVLSGFLLLLGWGRRSLPGPSAEWAEHTAWCCTTGSHEPQHKSCASALQSLPRGSQWGTGIRAAIQKCHGLELKKEKVVLRGCQKTHIPIGRGEFRGFHSKCPQFHWYLT